MIYPPDYATSRYRFREAAERNEWGLYSIAATGPGGEDLTIDIAVSSAPDAECVLVISGGLHGVEGPVGSAVQIALLEQLRDEVRIPSGVRCVLLHGLNPYGFAWSRRFDAENIDPNRNFLLDSESYCGSSKNYGRFDALLNPRCPPSKWDLFPAKALYALARHGRATLKQTLATGQYEYPKGLFFGGAGPCETYRLVRQHLRSWIGDARTVLHLDFHTGLGKWATCKLLIDYEAAPEQRDRLTRWFGAGAYEENDPEKIAYQPRGSFGRWCVRQDLASQYVFASPSSARMATCVCCPGCAQRTRLITGRGGKTP